MNIEFSTHPEDRQVEQQLISIIQQIEEKNKLGVDYYVLNNNDRSFEIMSGDRQHYVASVDAESKDIVMNKEIKTEMEFRNDINKNIGELDEKMKNEEFLNEVESFLNQSMSRNALAKATQKEKKMIYMDAKATVEKLEAQCAQQCAIARMNNANPEIVEEVKRTYEKIAEATKKQEQAKNNYINSKRNIIEKVKDTAYDAKRLISKPLNKIQAALTQKVAAGKQALANIRDTVADANGKFRLRGQSVYAGLETKVHQIERNYYSVCYSIDKQIAKNYEKAYTKLSDFYKHTNEIKSAAKDFGRALIGKERMKEEQPFTESQSKILTVLANGAKQYEQEMVKDEKNYKESQDKDIKKLKGIDKQREAKGMGKKFEELIKNVQARSARNNSGRNEQNRSQEER